MVENLHTGSHILNLQVWTFVLSDASFKTSGAQMYCPDIVVDKVKIVCVDSRFVEVKSNASNAGQIKTEPL